MERPMTRKPVAVRLAPWAALAIIMAAFNLFGG